MSIYSLQNIRTSGKLTQKSVPSKLTQKPVSSKLTQKSVSSSAQPIKNQSIVMSEGAVKNITTNIAGKMAGRAVGSMAGVSGKMGLRGAGVIGGALGQALIDRHDAKKQGITPPPFVSVKNFKNLKKSGVKSVKSLAKTGIVKGALTAATVGTGGIAGTAAVIGGRLVLDKGINKSMAAVKNKMAIRKLNKQKMKAENRDNHSASFMNNSIKKNTSSKLPSTPTTNGLKTNQMHTQGTTDLKTGKSKRCPVGTNRNNIGQCVM